MKITADKIRKALEQLEVSFQWPEIDPEQSYRIASLFNPVDGGFYFYSGEAPFKFNIDASLILASEDLRREDNGNALILLSSEDPQRVYYQILHLLFERRSGGEIAASARISPGAKLGKNVEVGEFCVIEDCILGDDVVISSHCVIHKGTRIGARTVIESGSIIGTSGVAWVWNQDQTRKIRQPQLGGVAVGQNCFLGANTVIVRGSLNEETQVGEDTMMAPGCRIGHGSLIGKAVHFANSVITGGNTRIGDFSFVGSAAVFRPKVKLHSRTIVGAGSVVVRDTTGEGLTLMGVPASEKPTKDRPQGMPEPKK